MEPIVIDNGTGIIRINYGGDEGPNTFPNIVGVPRNYAAMQGIKFTPYIAGDEALSAKGRLALRYPMEHGVITDWDAMTLVWSHMFLNELHIAPEEHPMLMLEAPFSSNLQREKTTMIFFEEFNVPAFYLAPAPVAGLMASGRNSGIMLDIGDGTMTVSPIINGYLIPQGTRRVNFAGRDLTHYMGRLLTESGVYLASRSADFEAIRDIKQETCYVALDYDEELNYFRMHDDRKKEYVLLDEQVITVNTERFRCPEALFQPHLVGLESLGVHELLHQAIMSTQGDNVPVCYSNIVLSGGTTTIPGFADRLIKEMKALAPPALEKKVKVVAPPERKYANWIGGSIMSSLSSFQSMWITKAEYDERGPGIVGKCRYW